MMTVQQRIQMCLLIEKMNEHKDFCKRLGLEDISSFRGKRIKREEGAGVC